MRYVPNVPVADVVRDYAHGEDRLLKMVAYAALMHGEKNWHSTTNMIFDFVGIRFLFQAMPGQEFPKLVGIEFPEG